MPLAIGQVLNNRYRIAKLIGQGGFGAVYRAWDLTLNQPIALLFTNPTNPAHPCPAASIFTHQNGIQRISFTHTAVSLAP